MYLTEEGKAYKVMACELLQKLFPREPLFHSVEVSITSYRPRKAGDIDGIVKFGLDVLKPYHETKVKTGQRNGRFHIYRESHCPGVIEDDELVVNCLLYKREDPKNPRIEITVKEVDICHTK